MSERMFMYVSTEVESSHQTLLHCFSATLFLYISIFIDVKSVNNVQMCCLGAIVLYPASQLITEPFGGGKTRHPYKC